MFLYCYLSILRIEIDYSQCYVEAVGNVGGEKNMKKIMILGSLFIGLSIGIPAFAQVVQTYDVTIPRVGSTHTGSIVKQKNNSAVHNNRAIGGNKRISTSIARHGNKVNITGSKTMGAGDRVLLTYNGGASAYKGARTTLRISTPVTTVVRVQAQGSWSPDNK